MTYKADGTYTASVMGQEAGGGTYTLDGDKLCTKSQLGEGCIVYPAGKSRATNSRSQARRWAKRP
jgi:hypothetical protein